MGSHHVPWNSPLPSIRWSYQKGPYDRAEIRDARRSLINEGRGRKEQEGSKRYPKIMHQFKSIKNLLLSAMVCHVGKQMLPIWSKSEFSNSFDVKSCPKWF